MHHANPHLQRAEILLSQNRFDLAENEARQAIGAEPNEPLAYSYLALCLSEREQWQPATEAARRAVSLDPADSYHHYALAHVLHDRNLLTEARAAVDEATRLDPDSPNNWALRAAIDLSQKQYRDALTAANRGLELDPENEVCTNIRAMALTNLGDRSAAGRAIDSNLARNPENPTSHANMGWTLLHQGEPRKAMEHFREALRLDPGMDWARSGIVEAMKARSPIYRVFLAYFLFMSRLPANAQWGILVGGYVAYQIARSVQKANPALSPYLTPLIAAYIAFAIGTIVTVPLFNLLLFTNRFGRYALRPDQRWAAAAFGLSLLPPLVFLVLWATGGGTAYKVCALLTGVFVIPVSLAGLARPGRARIIMTSITVALGLVCIALCYFLFTGQAPLNAFFLFPVACLGSTWISNALSSAREPAKH